MTDTPQEPDPKHSPPTKKRQLSLENGRIVERVEDEVRRTWKDSSGRTWEVSRWNASAMGIPRDWSPAKRPANLANPWQMMFTDPKQPHIHPSVPYTSDRPVSQLTNEDIADYWKRIVEKHPEFGSD